MFGKATGTAVAPCIVLSSPGKGSGIDTEVNVRVSVQINTQQRIRSPLQGGSTSAAGFALTSPERQDKADVRAVKVLGLLSRLTPPTLLHAILSRGMSHRVGVGRKRGELGEIGCGGAAARLPAAASQPSQHTLAAPCTPRLRLGDTSPQHPAHNASPPSSPSGTYA